jgi:RND superfamily putative drug exporter
MAVVVSLAVLYVVPIPLLRSVALGAVMAVATAMAASLFLLPAVLAWLGPNVNRLAVARAPERVGASPFWHGVGEFSMRHPVATVLVVSMLLLMLTAPALRMRSVVPDARTFGVESEVRTVEERLADPKLFDQSGISAARVLVKSEGAITRPDNLRRVHALVAKLVALPGVVEVTTPLVKLDPDASDAERDRVMRKPDVDQELSRLVHEDIALVTVRSNYYWQDPTATALLRAVRATSQEGLTLEVGGPTARMVDVRATLAHWGPIVASLVALWNFGVLLLAFRSVLVPLKAIVMNTLSVAASFGVLVWVFQDGRFADVLNYVPPGGIETAIPVIVFAVLFGLSMDYEVFLLSRIQEEVMASRSNQRGVVAGLAHTGRIITSAALILMVVIGAFASGDLIFIKELGVSMVTAIALDVTLVRALLVPATMQLLGEWNWWAPRWLAESRVRLH